MSQWVELDDPDAELLMKDFLQWKLFQLTF